MSKIRAVRLSPEDEKLVQAFLARNSIFDFTTLVRAALREFIKSPHMSFHAVSDDEALASKEQKSPRSPTTSKSRSAGKEGRP